MLLRSSFLVSALLPVAAASGVIGKDSNAITASSKLGDKLLSKARKLEQGDDERDMTWVVDYSIRFKSCHTITTVPNEEGGGEEGAGLINSNVVVFDLCPSDTCGGKKKCENGAEYAIDLAQFVDAYTEARLEAEEYKCEMIRENCYCNNNNDDEACENECYEAEDASYCIEYEGQEEFEVQRYLECNEMEDNQRLFIGPYCGDKGKSIFLGVFDDAGCVNHADDGLYIFERYNYQQLPFAYESIVKDDCISCEEVDEDNGNNNNNNNNNGDDAQEAEIIELCENLYMQAAKCESDLGSPSYSSYWYPDTTACNYIQNTLPLLDSVFSGNHRAAKALAGVFAFTTVALAGVGYWLHTKVKQTNVGLSDQTSYTAEES